MKELHSLSHGVSKASKALLVIGLLASLALASACSRDAQANPQAVDIASDTSSAPSVSESASVAVVGGGAGAAPAMVSVKQSGGDISVVGNSSVSVEPDLAILDMGIESIATTVAESRTQAAEAMAAVMGALAEKQIIDTDIRTTHFSIWPNYDYRSGAEGKIIDYRISNSIAVDVRDMKSLDAIVDSVIIAGGDDIRFRGISLTVETPSLLAPQLREDAIADAMAKAKHYADLSGVLLGDVTMIAEPSIVASSEPRYGAVAAQSSAAYFTPTRISPGEVEYSLSVNVSFDIR